MAERLNVGQVDRQLSYGLTDALTDKQTYNREKMSRCIYKQMNRAKIVKQIGRGGNEWTDRWIDRQVALQVNRWIDR